MHCWESLPAIRDLELVDSGELVGKFVELSHVTSIVGSDECKNNKRTGAEYLARFEVGKRIRRAIVIVRKTLRGLLKDMLSIGSPVK